MLFEKIHKINKNNYFALCNFFQIIMAKPWSQLKLAVRFGRTDKVKQLLEAHNFSLSDEDAECSSKKRAKLDTTDLAFNLLYAPVKNKHAEIVKLLLGHGFIIPQATPDYKSPLLFSAIKNRDEEMVQVLLNANHRVNVWNQDGQAALTESVKARNLKIIQMLIDKNADLNIRPVGHTLKDYTPLMKAAEIGYIKIMELLLNNGANVCALTFDKINVLAQAVEGKQMEVVKFLVSRGVNVNTGGKLPLMFAYENADENMIDYLLMNGAKPTAKADSFDYNYHSHKFISAFHQVVSPTNSIIYKTSKPLQMRTIRKFLKTGMDINATDNYGQTALHVAVTDCGARKNIEVVKLLLANGIDINAVSRTGDSALCVALRYSRNEPVVGLLIDNGADINFKIQASHYLNNSPRTIIEYAENIVKAEQRRGLKSNMHEVVLRQLAKQKSQSVVISKDIISYIERKPQLDSYYKRCLEEIKGMRSVFFNETNVSVCDLLFTRSMKKLVGYAKNQDIVGFQSSVKFKSQFPIYAEMIRQKFQEYTKRQRLIDDVKLQNFFRRVSEVSEGSLPVLPATCAQIVFSCLSDKDLKSMRRALEI